MGVIGRCNLHVHLTHQIHGVALRFFPAPEGQPVKRLKRPIHGAKQEKQNPQEEGSQYKYKWKKSLKVTPLWMESCVLEVRH